MKIIQILRPMRTQTADCFVVFGIFLTLLGVIGYVAHPEKALTALIFGGPFGALWMVWGILNSQGFRWSWLGGAGCHRPARAGGHLLDVPGTFNDWDPLATRMDAL